MTDRTDEQRFAEHGRQLAAAIDAVIEPWVTRCVTETCAAAGIPVDDRVRDAASDAARRCRREVAAEMAALVAADVDAQTVTPLQVLRTSVRFPTEALVDLGVEPPRRDDFDRRAFPEDIYGLGPAGFSDVDPSLRDPGLAWGAAKAHVVLARRRAEGRR